MRFAFGTVTAADRPDWKAVRDTIDLAAVATNLLGSPPGRRGEGGRKLWWNCPLHEDSNPSFCVDPGKPWWRCYGCGESGDAVALVRRLNPEMTFPEAVAFLTGGSVPTSKLAARPRPPAKPPAEPSGLPEAEALALVEAAAARLWTPEGSDALAYLHDGRGLTDETIRAARLGMVPPLELPDRPRGVVIPWFLGDRLAHVTIRQPGGREPKYREVFRDPARMVIYPGRHTIRTGRPLVISEGQFDALLLGQELDELAGVVTLGSASAEIKPEILAALLAAAPWFAATDNDPAGDKAAARWPERARRVRPPGQYKDWTEAHVLGRVPLRRWWSDVLAGVEHPPLFTWEELAALRWGSPPAGDPEPGIVIDTPRRREERIGR